MKAHERDIMMPKPQILKVHSACIYNLTYSHQTQAAHNSLWTILLISLNKKLYNWTSHAHMRKESIGHPVCLPMQVSSLLISISTEQRNTIGAHAVTLRTHHSAMVSASGSWQEIDLWPSTSQNLDTSSCATARCQLTLLSAMVLTRPCSSTFTNNTELSGLYIVSSPSGCVSHIGCSPSTSERVILMAPECDNME